MISSIASFKLQVVSLIVDIEKKRFLRFTNTEYQLEKHHPYVFKPQKYTAEIQSVVSGFEIHFGDFNKIEKFVEFINYPFNDTIHDTFEIFNQFAEIFQMDQLFLKMKQLLCPAMYF
ncbi:unnamed protein product [Diabrotica balteata]|uniref:Uncharacterized protein n=1 Tax=Diabrotica balteata TaxID=107213 RepID=A0A9N9SQN4_DIABA|nr:unnamed protein product [Diabrotica balteata]